MDAKAPRTESTMGDQDQGIRKAAILLDSLGPSAAAALLKLLSREQARRVRRAVIDLGKIDAGERQRVLEEFYRLGAAGKQPPDTASKLSGGVELAGGLAELARRHGSAQQTAETPGRPDQQSRPFQFLEEAEADKLARLLAAERPQTIALVLAHLTPQQAGNVLVRFSPALMAEVVRRLIDLEETDPEVLKEVEAALQSRYLQQVCRQRQRVAGLGAMMSILRAADQRAAARIMENLAAFDRSLAERLGPPVVPFEALARLDSENLARLVQAAGLGLFQIALLGARPELVQAYLRVCSPAQKQKVMAELENPGPFRLADVELARQKVVEIARQLALCGRIELPAQLPALV